MEMQCKPGDFNAWIEDELSRAVEKMSGRDPQGAWRRDKLIGGKLQVVK
jgi:hypothetical protein